jgi:hypothetical protein
MKKILTVTLLLEVSLFSVQAQQTGKLFKKKYIKKTMGKEPFLLEAFEFPQIKAETGANTGADLLTNAHMKNWMGCVRANNVKTNAPDEAGYSHSIANIMTTAALRTGQRATLDEKTKQVITGGKPFKY